MINAVEMGNISRHFEINFDKISLKTLQQFNGKVELINELGKKTKLLYRKYAYLVDTTKDISTALILGNIQVSSRASGL